MFWPLLAMGGMSALQTALGNKQQADQIKAANKAAYAADAATIRNAFQTIGSIQVQNTQLRTSAAQQLNDAEIAAYAATGSNIANAAAAGVKGASVDATLSEIDRELGQNEIRVEQSIEVEQYNLTNRIREVIAGASASLRGQQNPYANQQSPLLNGLMTAGSAYASNYMQFGSSTAAPKTGT